jgi:hypothetical protein
MNKTVKMIIETLILLILFTLALSGCSNPVQINNNLGNNNQSVNKDSIGPEFPEIIVWQTFRDPGNLFETEYRVVQMNEGFFNTYDSITVEPRDTLYCLGFEIEWNTQKYIYTLNKINYMGNGWKDVNLRCSRKYEIFRTN